LQLSDWLGVAGLIVSAVGFALTIWQLIRTANASIATKNAIIEANKRMVLNHLLVLLPQLTSIEADLDAAIASDDRDGAVRLLVKFSHAANQIAALLENRESREDVDFVDELRTVAKSASASKGALVSGTSKPLRIVLKTLDAEIGSVTAKCAGMVTKYQTKVA